MDAPFQSGFLLVVCVVSLFLFTDSGRKAELKSQTTGFLQHREAPVDLQVNVGKTIVLSLYLLIVHA